MKTGDTKKVENSLNTLRTMMFEEMIALRDGDRTPNESIAVAKLGSQIISSYKVEVDAVKVANDLKQVNGKYAKALTVLEHKPDDQ